MSDENLTVISEIKDIRLRITEVNAELSKWLTSKSNNYDCEKDMLRLSKIFRQHNSYIYQYEILKGEINNCMPLQDVDIEVDEKETTVHEWVLRQIDMLDMPIGA